MSDIENRLRASMRFGVLDGSAEERGILEVQIEEAIRELVRLRARAEAAERERDLTTSQLLMVGSEICGDPKLDPKDHRDPRWTSTLEEAAKLRADNERLRTDLASAEEALRRVALQLEQALGTSAAFWISREARYREHLARRQAAERECELSDEDEGSEG